MNTVEMISKFEQSVREGFANYTKFGTRSNKRILPIHDFVSDLLSEIFGDNFIVEKEYNIHGFLYQKKVDIVVLEKNSKTPVFCIGVKFITRNYKQNANNYFEGMIGETSNVQRSGVPYAHLIIMRDEVPYYKRSGKKTKNELINMRDIQKYFNLISDKSESITPFSIAVPFFHINEETCETKILESNEIMFLNTSDNSGNMEKYNSLLSLSNFVENIISYRNTLKEYN
jgi:hypothetical protein